MGFKLSFTGSWFQRIMGRILAADEREGLLARHRRERDGRVKDRIKAVLWRDDGLTYSEIAVPIR